jgi:uncharacterized membrane protein YccF (DUF307 family)
MNIVIRAVWFLFVGWWVGALWVFAAVLATVSIVFAPIGVVMAQKTWQIMTLKTSPNVVVKEVRVDSND